MNKRIINNNIASAGSIFWTTLVQLLSVPALISFWGLEQYGLWVILSTVPTYITLSDLGFTSAATAEMTMSYAKGNVESTKKTLSALSSVVLFVSLLTVTVTSLLVLICWHYSIFDASFTVYATFVLLVVYGCLAMYSRVPLAVFRSTGHYAFGTIVYDIVQFTESILMLLLALKGFGYIGAALGLLFGRSVLLIVMLYLVNQYQPNFFKLGLSAKSEIKRLIPSSLAAMTIPTSLSINMQGITVLAGFLISPVAVATLAPARTMSRVAIQFVGIFNRSIMPEFSAAVSKNDKSLISKLLSTNLLIYLFILVPGAIVYAIFGGYVINLWTNGQVTPPSDFLFIIAFAMLVHGGWFFSANLLLSVSKHKPLANTLLISSVLSLLVCYLLAPSFGLLGIAIAILFMELLVAFRVFVIARHELNRIYA